LLEQKIAALKGRVPSRIFVCLAMLAGAGAGATIAVLFGWLVW
jgi:hypothetical protein